MNDAASLRRPVLAVLGRWWLVLLLLVVAGGVSHQYSLRQPQVYEATTSLVVGQSIYAVDPSIQDLTTSEQLALTYADIAKRQPVLAGTVGALGLDYSWQQLKSRVRVNRVLGTQVLEIKVEASSPVEASLVADEIAHQLILQSPTTSEDVSLDETQLFIEERLVTLRQKIEDGQQNLEELERMLEQNLPDAVRQQTLNKIASEENRLNSWENNYVRYLGLRDNRNSPNILAIIEPAQSRPTPIRPDITRNVLLASGLGVLWGIALALLLEYFDDTVRTPEELTNELGLASLGTVSRMPGRGYQSKLITTARQSPAFAEAFRMIRSNIQFASLDRRGKIILVTSAVPREGKSTIVANLGIAIAQSGLRTLIVDADLRRPVQHEIFEVTEMEGLSGLLRNPQLDIDTQLQLTQYDGLQVLTSGNMPSNPSDLLGSRHLGPLLDSLTERADVILLDVSPVTMVADAVVLSSQAHAVILVIEAGQTRLGVVRQALFQLNQAGANVWGAVLNRTTPVRKYYRGKHSGSYLNHILPSHRSPSQPQPAAAPEFSD